MPLNQRFVETVSPGFLFGETNEVKCPTQSWDDVDSLAKYMRGKNSSAVGFMRFIYHPEHGKVYKDKGWVYFKGVKVSKEDALSGKAKKMYPNIPLTEIALSNIKCNNWDYCLYISEYGKLWPLHKDDVVVPSDS